MGFECSDEDGRRSLWYIWNSEVPVMNKIVKEHYPAAKLPEDLREGLDPARLVTITVTLESDQPARKPMTLEEIFALRRPPFRSGQEIDESIRQQRDEWDY
jgi:hypothetical protein